MKRYRKRYKMFPREKKSKHENDCRDDGERTKPKDI